MSVDPPEVSEALRRRLGAQFTFLSDPEGRVLDMLNIRHKGGYTGKDIAIPTSILVDKNGIVRWTYQSDFYRTRARPEDVFRAIDQLAS